VALLSIAAGFTHPSIARICKLNLSDRNKSQKDAYGVSPAPGFVTPGMWVTPGRIARAELPRSTNNAAKHLALVTMQLQSRRADDLLANVFSARVQRVVQYAAYARTGGEKKIPNARQTSS